jgi:hypothetical protein
MSEEFKLLHRGDFTIYPTLSWLKPWDILQGVGLVENRNQTVVDSWLDVDYFSGAGPDTFSIYDFEYQGDVSEVPEWQILAKIHEENQFARLTYLADMFLVRYSCLQCPETVRIENSARRPWQLPSKNPADILGIYGRDLIMYFQYGMFVVRG